MFPYPHNEEAIPGYIVNFENASQELGWMGAVWVIAWTAQTLPFMLWPSIVATTLILGLAVLRHGWQFPSGTGALLFGLSGAALGVAIFRSLGALPYESLKDLPQIMFVVMILGIRQQTSRLQWRDALEKGARWTALLAIPGSVLGLGKLWWTLQGRDLGFLAFDGTIPIGTSLCPDYNIYALALMGSAIFAAVGFRHYRPSGRLFGLCLAMLHLSASLFAGSRRAWVMAPFAIALIAWHSRKGLAGGLKKNVVSTLGVLTSLGVVTALLLFAIGSDEMLSSSETSRLASRFMITFDGGDSVGGGLSDGFQERVIRWDTASDLIVHSTPMELAVGSGMDYVYTFGHLTGTPGAQDHPHNPILAAVLYGGIPVALLAVLALAWPLLHFLQNPRPPAPLGAAIILGLAFGLPSANTMFSLWIMILPPVLTVCCTNSATLAETDPHAN